jgi:peptidoglycan hydrolase-like protein with peptidoglycan-binding domain
MDSDAACRGVRQHWSIGTLFHLSAGWVYSGPKQATTTDIPAAKSGHEEEFMLTSPKFMGNQRLQAAARNLPPLKAPEKSDAVRLLQEALASLGYTFPASSLGGRFDGIYGNETTQRVMQFQRAQGLMADGAAGQETFRRLDSLIGGQPDPTQQNSPGSGAQGGAGGASGQGGAGSGQGGGFYAEALRSGARLVCPHNGNVRGSPIPGSDLMSGLSQGQVTNCQGRETGFIGPPGFCIMVKWTGADYQHMVNGHPAVRRAAPGICIDQYGMTAGPVIVVSN